MNLTAKTGAAAPKGEIIVSVRPPSDAWAIPGLFLILSVLMPIGIHLLCDKPPNSLPLPAALGFGSMLFAPGALMIAWLCHQRVSATKTGLLWRKWFKRTETPWDDIGDFYIVPFEHRRTRTRGEVGLYHDLRVTDKQGRVAAAFFSSFRNSDALKACIVARAVHAKPREWQLKGTRPFDPLPRVFTYDTRESRYIPFWFALLGSLTVLLCGGMTVDFIWESVTRHEFGWWIIGLSTLFMSVPVLVGILVATVVKTLKAGVRTGERFIVDRDGFTFCAESRFERVLWKNVTRYGYAPGKPAAGAWNVSHLPPFRIETATQGVFDFADGLGDKTVLREIIRVNAAANAHQAEWPAPPFVSDSAPGAARLPH